MRAEQLLKKKRNAVMALAAKHGAKNLRIFGSAARGESAEGKEAFFADPRTQDAVIRNFEVIGEAAKCIPEQYRRGSAVARRAGPQ
jgi:hypothetical protein